MKTRLKISILANLGLLGLLVYLLTAIRTQNHALAGGDMTAQVVQPSFPAIEPHKKTEPRPFRWSQLESSDYRIYVANLRAIGCPEQTVRDIIQADVGSLYSAKRGQLRLSEAGSGPWSRGEEMQLLASLIGGPPATSSRAESAAAGTNAVSVPLVFQKVDLVTLGLNAGQREAIEELREQFVTQIGGLNQDPNDPAYRERWQQLQPQNDELLRGMIGINAFQNFQLQAAGAPADAY